jgi:hypothetical protein
MKNYGPDKPKHLVVLWWNWPPEHWDELQDMASMNFLQEPPPGLVDNSAMTADQLETTISSVNELIEKWPPSQWSTISPSSWWKNLLTDNGGA